MADFVILDLVGPPVVARRRFALPAICRVLAMARVCVCTNGVYALCRAGYKYASGKNSVKSLRHSAGYFYTHTHLPDGARVNFQSMAGNIGSSKSEFEKVAREIFDTRDVIPAHPLRNHWVPEFGGEKPDAIQEEEQRVAAEKRREKTKNPAKAAEQAAIVISNAHRVMLDTGGITDEPNRNAVIETLQIHSQKALPSNIRKLFFRQEFKELMTTLKDMTIEEIKTAIIQWVNDPAVQDTRVNSLLRLVGTDASSQSDEEEKPRSVVRFALPRLDARLHGDTSQTGTRAREHLETLREGGGVDAAIIEANLPEPGTNTPNVSWRHVVLYVWDALMSEHQHQGSSMSRVEFEQSDLGLRAASTILKSVLHCLVVVLMQLAGVDNNGRHTFEVVQFLIDYINLDDGIEKTVDALRRSVGINTDMRKWMRDMLSDVPEAEADLCKLVCGVTSLLCSDGPGKEYRLEAPSFNYIDLYRNAASIGKKEALLVECECVWALAVARAFGDDPSTYRHKKTEKDLQKRFEKLYTDAKAVREGGWAVRLLADSEESRLFTLHQSSDIAKKALAFAKTHHSSLRGNYYVSGWFRYSSPVESGLRSDMLEYLKKYWKDDKETSEEEQKTKQLIKSLIAQASEKGRKLDILVDILKNGSSGSVRQVRWCLDSVHMHVENAKPGDVGANLELGKREYELSRVDSAHFIKLGSKDLKLYFASKFGKVTLPEVSGPYEAAISQWIERIVGPGSTFVALAPNETIPTVFGIDNRDLVERERAELYLLHLLFDDSQNSGFVYVRTDLELTQSPVKIYQMTWTYTAPNPEQHDGYEDARDVIQHSIRSSMGVQAPAYVISRALTPKFLPKYAAFEIGRLESVRFTSLDTSVDRCKQGIDLLLDWGVSQPSVPEIISSTEDWLVTELLQVELQRSTSIKNVVNKTSYFPFAYETVRQAVEMQLAVRAAVTSKPKYTLESIEATRPMTVDDVLHSPRSVQRTLYLFVLNMVDINAPLAPRGLTHRVAAASVRKPDAKNDNEIIFNPKANVTAGLLTLLLRLVGKWSDKAKKAASSVIPRLVRGMCIGPLCDDVLAFSEMGALVAKLNLTTYDDDRLLMNSGDDRAVVAEENATSLSQTFEFAHKSLPSPSLTLRLSNTAWVVRDGTDGFHAVAFPAEMRVEIRTSVWDDKDPWILPENKVKSFFNSDDLNAWLSKPHSWIELHEGSSYPNGARQRLPRPGNTRLVVRAPPPGAPVLAVVYFKLSENDVVEVSTEYSKEGSPLRNLLILTRVVALSATTRVRHLLGGNPIKGMLIPTISNDDDVETRPVRYVRQVAEVDTYHANRVSDGLLLGGGRVTPADFRMSALWMDPSLNELKTLAANRNSDQNLQKELTRLSASMYFLVRSAGLEDSKLQDLHARFPLEALYHLCDMFARQKPSRPAVARLVVAYKSSSTRRPRIIKGAPVSGPHVAVPPSCIPVCNRRAPETVSDTETLGAAMDRGRLFATPMYVADKLRGLLDTLAADFGQRSRKVRVAVTCNTIVVAADETVPWRFNSEAEPVDADTLISELRQATSVPAISRLLRTHEQMADQHRCPPLVETRMIHLQMEKEVLSMVEAPNLATLLHAMGVHAILRIFDSLLLSHVVAKGSQEITAPNLGYKVEDILETWKSHLGPVGVFGPADTDLRLRIRVFQEGHLEGQSFGDRKWESFFEHFRKPLDATRLINAFPWARPRQSFGSVALAFDGKEWPVRDNAYASIQWNPPRESDQNPAAVAGNLPELLSNFGRAKNVAEHLCAGGGEDTPVVWQTSPGNSLEYHLDRLQCQGDAGIFRQDPKLIGGVLSLLGSFPPMVKSGSGSRAFDIQTARDIIIGPVTADVPPKLPMSPKLPKRSRVSSMDRRPMLIVLRDLWWALDIPHGPGPRRNKYEEAERLWMNTHLEIFNQVSQRIETRSDERGDTHEVKLKALSTFKGAVACAKKAPNKLQLERVLSTKNQIHMPGPEHVRKMFKELEKGLALLWKYKLGTLDGGSVVIGDHVQQLDSLYAVIDDKNQVTSLFLSEHILHAQAGDFQPSKELGKRGVDMVESARQRVKPLLRPLFLSVRDACVSRKLNEWIPEGIKDTRFLDSTLYC